VNLQDKWIDLFTRKKADGSLTPRRIGYSNELRKLLQWWRRRNPRAEYVFQSDRKDHQPLNYTWSRNVQRKLCERAGVEYFSLHSWRHYYTSILVSKGYDLAKIQALLGHQNIRTTGIYVHAIAGLEVGESLATLPHTQVSRRSFMSRSPGTVLLVHGRRAFERRPDTLGYLPVPGQDTPPVFSRRRPHVRFALQ